MGIIDVTNIKLYGYHGCMDEEAAIGTDYRIDVRVYADLELAAQTDNLEHTVDYVEVNRIVKEQMEVRAKLIEVVAQRIIDELLRQIPRIDKVEVTVRKMSPPIMGNVESVAVTLTGAQKKKANFSRMNVRLVILSFLLPLVLVAQIEQRRTPRSWELNFDISTSEIRVDSLNAMALRADAQLRDLVGGVCRVGREVAFRANPSNSGRWFRDSNGNHFWTIRIVAPTAQAVSVLFESLILPRGSELYAYSADKNVRRGAFTERNNRRDGWTIAPIRGNEILLEYWAPARVAERPVIEVSGIGFFFRGFEPRVVRDYGDSGPCQVNANCSEGNSFDDERKSVVRIVTKNGPFFGFCSGALINTTEAGCDPYILSANHCTENTSSPDFGLWTFYFNYESPNCSDPGSDVGLDLQSMVGCSVLASTGVSDLSSGSDFLLVELNGSVPTVFGAYYSGWIRGVAANSGVTIHHPSGDLKKVSTFTSTPQTTSWPGSSTPNRHWLVNWQSTANGHGTTEGGSSGAPLLTNQGRIFGVLSGGLSSCTNLTGVDYYGKFSTAWNMDGGTVEFKLAPWLDPLGLGLNTLAGTYPPCESASLNETSLQWSVYPNPAAGRLNLNLPPATESVRIVDAFGRVLWQREKPAQEERVDTGNWPSGVYFAQVLSEGQISNRPVVVL